MAAQEWQGRNALVTGGTGGTGMACARRLVEGGARVVVVGRDGTRGEEALVELRSLASDPTAVTLTLGDCADAAIARHVVAEAVARLGELDVLVSAGARGQGNPKPFADMSPEEVETGMASRFHARVHPIHAALPHLRQGASVVLLTTDAGRHATRGESIVGAYAAAVMAFTKTLARELSRQQIRVNAVSMTLTSDTRSWESIFGSESYQRELFTRAIERFPFGSPPSATDVADAVLFLASARAAHVTGQTLSVNGGLSYGGW